VETSANQSTLDFVLAKRRRGKSAMAQNVGTIGKISIAINISKFNYQATPRYPVRAYAVYGRSGGKLFNSAGFINFRA
jgi:hypothetical protein